MNKKDTVKRKGYLKLGEVKQLVQEHPAKEWVVTGLQ